MNKLAGELLAELIAVAIIITLGDSVAAMYVLYDPSPYAQAYWGVCIAWGMAVTLAIYVTGSVSGTHANPAVTLALCLHREFPWKKFFPYVAAQVAGGFVGAALVYQLYGPVIDHYNAAHNAVRNLDSGAATAGIFFTHPGLAITPWHAFGDEIILTAVLLLGIFAITDQFSTVAPQAGGGALAIGLLVAVIGAAGGYLEGWAINPARDLGPRLFTFTAGWGEQAFPSPGNYWWVPIAGPLIGGVLGASLYQYGMRPFMKRS